MVSSKWFLSAVAFMLAGGAHAQVSTTKTAKTYKDLVSSQAANVQLRNYYYNQYDAANKDEVAGEIVATQVRGNFTVKTFSDVVSTTLTMAATSTSGNDGVVSQRQPELYTEIAAFDSDYLAVSPYLDLYTAMAGEPTRGELGLKPILKHPAIDTAVGPLNFELMVEAEGVFASREKASKAKTDPNDDKVKSWGIVKDEDGTDRVEDNDNGGMNYEILYTPSISLGMDKVAKGLKLYTYAEYTFGYEPYIYFQDDGSDRGKRTTRYAESRNSTTYLGAEYKITDKLSIIDEFAVLHTDIYGSKGGDQLSKPNNQYANIAMLSYTMF